MLGILPGDRGTTNPTQQGFIDGTAITSQSAIVSALSSAAGAVGVSGVTTMPDAPGAPPQRSFAELFYFRVWAIPRTLDAQNPRRNTPIPFYLWNAYLDDNRLADLTTAGADGLTIDIAKEDVLAALELRTVHITITDEAPYSVDATFTFDFDLGGTAMRFLALLADILPIEADTGITERFEWLTDVLPNYDGTEQRIALRSRPRRSFVLNLSLLNDADRKALYDKLYKTLALSVVTPAWQYQTLLKADTVIGDNKIYCNPRRADLRVGNDVILLTREGVFFYYKIEAVADDYVTISTAFSQVIPARGTKVVGGLAGRMPDGTGLSMMARSGQAQITVSIIDSQDQIAHPDWSVTIPTLDGLPLMLKRPLAAEQADEAMNAGLEVIDNETGKPAQYTAWDQRYVSGQRQYLINNQFAWQDIQYWRTFLDYCRGQQRAFFAPTFREDLVQQEGTEFLVGQITVAGTEYAQLYAGSPTYQHLEIESSVGTFQVTVANIENQGDRTQINFADAIDADLTGATVSRISYVLRYRLGSDTVELQHQTGFTYVNLVLKTVKV